MTLSQRVHTLIYARADDTCGGWDESEQGEAVQVLREMEAEVARLRAALSQVTGLRIDCEVSRAEDALELILTLRRIHMTARRALSFGKQATPQAPERMVERRDEFLAHIVGMCEDAGVEPPTILKAKP